MVVIRGEGAVDPSTWIDCQQYVYCMIQTGTSCQYLRLRSEDKLNWEDAKAMLKTWTLWVHYIVYAGTGCAITSLSLSSPTIAAGLGYKDLEAQLFTIPTYAVATLFTVVGPLLSDRYYVAIG